MLNPFAGKTLEELEVIRKAKSNTAERYLNDIAMIDKEIAIKKAAENIFGVPFYEAERQVRTFIMSGEVDQEAWKEISGN